MNNDDSNIDPIIGAWQLTDMIIWQSEFEFSPGEVIYEFNTDGTLDITSSRPEIESRTLTYEIINDCIFSIDCLNGATPRDLLIINDLHVHRNIFNISNNNTELYFGESWRDGPDYYLERMP